MYSVQTRYVHIVQRTKAVCTACIETVYSVQTRYVQRTNAVCTSYTDCVQRTNTVYTVHKPLYRCTAHTYRAQLMRSNIYSVCNVPHIDGFTKQSSLPHCIEFIQKYHNICMVIINDNICMIIINDNICLIIMQRRRNDFNTG